MSRMSEQAAEQQQFEQEFQCDDIHLAEVAHQQEEEAIAERNSANKTEKGTKNEPRP